MGQTMTKDPDARLPVAISWSLWAANEGEDITSSGWELTDENGAVISDPDDGWLVIEESPIASLTENVATVWLSGGTAGQTYRVTNTVETDGLRKDERTLRILVRQR
jgi:hypothetical protein